MKQIVFIASAMLSIAGLCSAAPCANGTLSSYVALGATGCSIGTNTLYDFQILSGGTAGATAIAPASISVSAMGGNYSPALTFTTNQTATAPSLLEAFFTYRVSGNGYAGSMNSIGGSSETGDGAVTNVQDYCAGGLFTPAGVSGCTGNHGTLTSLDGVQQSDRSTFAPVSFLNITDDITLDGGAAGSATGGTFSDQFAAVPEPVSFLLTAFGLALAGVRFRSAGAKLFKQ
jgi:hypothetical protein